MTKEEYLKDFERKNSPSDLFGEISKSAGEEVIKVLKAKDMTYEQAYAALRYAYQLINFESNFLKLN